MAQQPHLSQTCANMLRAVRNQIGLLYGISSANEKNDVIDLWRGAYWLAVQTGQDPEKLIQDVLRDYSQKILRAIIVEQKRASSRNPDDKDKQIAIASRVLKSLKQ